MSRSSKRPCKRATSCSSPSTGSWTERSACQRRPAHLAAALSDDEASESPLAAAVEVAGAALGGATWPGPSESPRATLSVEASDTPDEPYRETHFFSLSFGELNGERVTHSAAERYWPLRASRCARNAFESAKTWYAWTGDYVCVCVVHETRRDKAYLAAMSR